MKRGIVLLVWAIILLTLAIAESHKDCEHRGGLLPCGLSRKIEHFLKTGTPAQKNSVGVNSNKNTMGVNSNKQASMLQPQRIVNNDRASPARRGSGLSP
jgi:hypothetical protein